MFSGLVETIGSVVEVSGGSKGLTLELEAALPCPLELGDSLCVEGVCLTVEALSGPPQAGADPSPVSVGKPIGKLPYGLTPPAHSPERPLRRYCFSVMGETLEKTTLSQLKQGGLVNLEPALTLADPLGGHLVLGHVDGVGVVVGVQMVQDTLRLTLEAPPTVTPYLVPQGSLALNGVSLTVAVLSGSHVTVSLIPHTLRHTTLGLLIPSDPVNLEADILGKYVYRYLAAHPRISGR